MLRTIATAGIVLAAVALGQTPGSTKVPAHEDVAAPPADAEKTESGLCSKILTPGHGANHPAKTDLVTVHYTGWTTDGKMFDSSLAAAKPATFPLDRVIAGWTEGVQLMVAGEKAPVLDSPGACLQGKRRKACRNAGLRRGTNFLQRAGAEACRGGPDKGAR